MYAPPEAYKTLIQNYKDVLDSLEHARLMVNVELTLHLATELGFAIEPLTVGWVLLSRMPLSHPLLSRLLPEQRKMLANAAQIIPLSSRFSWQRALAQYAQEIPKERRLYNIAITRLDEESIEDCRKYPSPDPLREAQYQEILTATLPFVKRHRREVATGATYRVMVKTEDSIHVGRVKITKDLQDETSDQQAWFNAPRPRKTIKFTLRDLLPTAKFLDAREGKLKGRIHWVHDLEQIRFRHAVTQDGQIQLGEDETANHKNAKVLEIKGMIHLPGMVSAGKTTLAKLIIAHCLRLRLDVRITFVVGDSQTAIATAHQINSWFHNDPAGEEVSAVPLMGKSQRAVHWERLRLSKEYKEHIQEGYAHWGERWLMPICMIEPHVKWEGSADVVIPLGNEPCEGFITEQKRSKRKHKRGGERCFCPLTNVCPSKQLYRDMPKALAWITTPGALSQASLPLYWDTRISKLGELVYEQSDLVILDEVETIVDWFDRTYARVEPLTNGINGLLDKLDLQIAQFWLTNRLLTPDQRRWVLAVRESLKTLTGVLSAIANPDQERVVKNWVKSGYFSPNQLAYRLARRLAGLKEWDDTSLPPDKKREHDQRTDITFKPFNDLLNRFTDPLRRSSSPANATDELASIMQAINNLADNVTDQAILHQCRAWIVNHHSDMDARLAALKHELEQSTSEYDQKYADKNLDRSVDDLAHRLQFLLMVALLDRHIHIVTEEWHNKPEMLTVQQPFSRIPRGMRHILPLPLTGQQYGFVIDAPKSGQDEDSASRISLFAYTNIGRSYLLNFHQLFQDFDGQTGPHILALSGTSYLPDSTAFHVNIPPAGVLMPAKQIEQALNMSQFIWRPFYEKKKSGEKPIFVSGTNDKRGQLRHLIAAMLTDGGVSGGFISHILEQIRNNARNPETGHLWRDRERVLLLTNSYTQAHEVATTLRDGWREAADTIYELKRGSADQDYQIEFDDKGTLNRMDIEQFASTNGQVLVAPMQSIGRGFNILNNLPEPTAAFGAVLFLTRPMNPPHDKEGSAQELNRYALEWAADPAFSAWGQDILYKRAIKAREAAETARRAIEARYGYADFTDDEDLNMFPRRDLAATSAGRVIQAVGRLLRGGVPFYAYFIDAAWSPKLAEKQNIHEIEPEDTSLLTAMSNILDAYSFSDPVGEALYSGISDVLRATLNRDSN